MCPAGTVPTVITTPSVLVSVQTIDKFPKGKVIGILVAESKILKSKYFSYRVSTSKLTLVNLGSSAASALLTNGDSARSRRTKIARP
jgi:hypothetical protein